MQVFICGCCDGKFPSLHKHTHHKIPKSLGGKDTPNNLIDICPSCHDALHAIAHKMMGKKMSAVQIVDAVALIYPDNSKAQKTCLDLAAWVRNAMVSASEKGMGPNHIVSVTTSLRMYYKPLMQSRQKELGATQEGYVRGLILSDLARRFNLEINHVEEKRIMDNIKKQRSLPTE